MKLNQIVLFRGGDSGELICSQPGVQRIRYYGNRSQVEATSVSKMVLN